MKYAREFITNTVVGGVLVLLPVYLAFLLLAKLAQAAHGLVVPVAGLLPAWGPAAVDVLALTILLLLCSAIGLAVHTRTRRAIRERVQKSLFDMAGAVYVLARTRVHPIDVPFTQATRCVSRWGSGSRELVAQMEGATGPGREEAA